uniref:Uncharacterized protein n=1 Tax=Sphaerodactylus townsendi TaxID=933632 RepID=A0ACB8EWI3_9SAUR
MDRESHLSSLICSGVLESRIPKHTMRGAASKGLPRKAKVGSSSRAIGKQGCGVDCSHHFLNTLCCEALRPTERHFLPQGSSTKVHPTLRGISRQYQRRPRQNNCPVARNVTHAQEKREERTTKGGKYTA